VYGGIEKKKPQLEGGQQSTKCHATRNNVEGREANHQ